MLRPACNRSKPLLWRNRARPAYAISPILRIAKQRETYPDPSHHHSSIPHFVPRPSLRSTKLQRLRRSLLLPLQGRHRPSRNSPRRYGMPKRVRLSWPNLRCVNRRRPLRSFSRRPQPSRRRIPPPYPIRLLQNQRRIQLQHNLCQTQLPRNRRPWPPPLLPMSHRGRLNGFNLISICSAGQIPPRLSTSLSK